MVKMLQQKQLKRFSIYFRVFLFRGILPFFVGYVGFSWAIWKIKIQRVEDFGEPGRLLFFAKK